jgi:hypothetical protein
VIEKTMNASELRDILNDITSRNFPANPFLRRESQGLRIMNRPEM